MARGFMARGFMARGFVRSSPTARRFDAQQVVESAAACGQLPHQGLRGPFQGAPDDRESMCGRIMVLARGGDFPILLQGLQEKCNSLGGEQTPLRRQRRAG